MDKTKKNNKLNNSIILNKILNEITVLRSDVVSIKTDIVKIKSDVSNIEFKLNDLTKNYNDYTKKEADIQEHKHRNFIMNLLKYNNTAPTIIEVGIKKFYNKSNAEITEFDGCVYISSRQPYNINIQNRLKSSGILHIPSPEKLAKHHTLIIIESKHSGNKHKVDTKMKQMKKIYDLLKSLDTLENTTIFFQNFMTSFLNTCNITLNELPMNIDLIFSSDDISPYLRDYIIAINRGITEEEYIYHCSIMFKNDKYVSNIVDMICEQNNTKEGIKTSTKIALARAYADKLSPNIQTIITLFEEVPKKYKHTDITMYFTQYNVLEPYFKFMKNAIGICQFNKATFPQLFAVDNLNTAL
jgi:hypothetical protein